METAVGRVGEQAFAQLVREHAGSLWRFAMARLGDAHEAEDVMQETFLRAWRAMDGWRGEASLRTWLHAICRNLCTDRLRARRVATVPLDGAEVAGALPSIAPSQERGGDRELLSAALAGLSEEEREAFVLIDALGFSGEEAARICDVPATTMRSRLHRGHRKLAAALQEVDHDL